MESHKLLHIFNEHKPPRKLAFYIDAEQSTVQRIIE